MKKFLSVVALSFLFANSYATWPVISRTTSGGIFNLYNRTSRNILYYTGVNGETLPGWDIKCEGYGFASCPNSIPLDPGNTLDVVDVDRANSLVEYVDDRIETVPNGTYSVQVQVGGESFLRVYTVTWSTDAEGGTQTVVDRADLPN